MGILICGLNGTGKSTLGRLLANRMEYKFIDMMDDIKRENERLMRIVQGNNYSG